MSTETTVLDELLGPVGRCLTPESAKRLVALRASPTVQARIEELAEQSDTGRLTREEQAEYASLVSAGTFIAVLQSKARKLLKDNGSA
ncbi:MAG: hypothetical protein IID46_03795 [Planctomycetes bacterium]|nr:hypothetical protein [Planctomycetota bacterium]